MSWLNKAIFAIKTFENNQGFWASSVSCLCGTGFQRIKCYYLLLRKINRYMFVNSYASCYLIIVI